MKIKFLGTTYLIERYRITPMISDYPDTAKIEGCGRLNGKKCIVIGGNSGIGLSIVKTYLREGATVVATARKPGELVDISNKHLKFVQWDISNYEETRTVLNNLYDEYGFFDCIVVSAGVNVLPPNVPYDRWEEYRYNHAINTVGVSEINRYVKEIVLRLKPVKRPKLVNIISAGAYYVSHEPYFTSKHAIYSFTRAFMEECKGIIDVYGICPGEVSTKMIRHKNFTLFSRIAKDSRKAHPDEIAEIALLIAEDAGTALARNMIVIDGGERIYTLDF